MALRGKAADKGFLPKRAWGQGKFGRKICDMRGEGGRDAITISWGAHGLKGCSKWKLLEVKRPCLTEI